MRRHSDFGYEARIDLHLAHFLAGEMSTPFEVGEQVLALNAAQLYLAKVLKVRTSDSTGEIEYLVHYQGWKSRWDEWLPLDKVHPDNEESRILQGKLKSQAAVEDKFSAREKEKRKDEEDEARPTLRLNIPHILQKALLEDGERMGRGTANRGLPIRPTVGEVLQEFLTLKASNPIENHLMSDMIQGLMMYFDKALGMMLLYEEERAEYKEFRAQNPAQRMCDVYGTAHLLRLLVKLPLLLNQAKMEAEGIKALQPRIQELLRYLEVHSDRLLYNK